MLELRQLTKISHLWVVGEEGSRHEKTEAVFDLGFCGLKKYTRRDSNNLPESQGKQAIRDSLLADSLQILEKHPELVQLITGWPELSDSQRADAINMIRSCTNSKPVN